MHFNHNPSIFFLKVHEFQLQSILFFISLSFFFFVSPQIVCVFAAVESGSFTVVDLHAVTSSLSLPTYSTLYKRKRCCPSTIIGLMLTGVAVAACHHGNHSAEETVIFQLAGHYGKPITVLMGRRREEDDVSNFSFA